MLNLAGFVVLIVLNVCSCQILGDQFIGGPIGGWTQQSVVSDAMLELAKWATSQLARLVAMISFPTATSNHQVFVQVT